MLIRDITNPITFRSDRELVDEGVIDRAANATMLRSDYAIGIPNAPCVADVDDEVLIKLDFVATS